MREPDFIIAGVAKAGTTSLYRYLGEHPQVGLSHKKELNYFALEDPVISSGWPHLRFPASTWDEYLDSFPDDPEATVVGEASPIYFESESAPRAISERLPNVKIIISLRNPVERAYSGYLMHVRDGVRRLDDTAIVRSRERFITGGYYAEKLRRFQQYFPPQRLAFVLFDDLQKQPLAVMQKLYEFLGLADTGFEPATARRHNKGSYPRLHSLNAVLKSDFVRHRLAPVMPAWLRQAGHRLLSVNSRQAPAMSETLRRSLQELYENDIREVSRIIDRDLSHWSGPS